MATMLAVTRDGRLHVLVSKSSEACLCGVRGPGQFAEVFPGTFEDFRRDRVRCNACLSRLRN